MPWLETDVRDQRIRFVIAATHPNTNLTATCRAFGISRKTGYKWLDRHAAAASVTALADQSRRPQHSPQRTSDWITARVVAVRQLYGWGGDKLVSLLAADGSYVERANLHNRACQLGLEFGWPSDKPYILGSLPRQARVARETFCDAQPRSIRANDCRCGAGRRQRHASGKERPFERELPLLFAGELQRS